MEKQEKGLGQGIFVSREKDRGAPDENHTLTKRSANQKEYLDKRL